MVCLLERFWVLDSGFCLKRGSDPLRACSFVRDFAGPPKGQTPFETKPWFNRVSEVVAVWRAPRCVRWLPFGMSLLV